MPAMNERRRWYLRFIPLVSTLMYAPTALAQGGAACGKAAEEAQALRDGGQLQAALDKLVRCSADHCPVVVRKDCVTWMDQVEKAIPSVIVNAVDSRGHDVMGVRVIVDGKVVRERLDGREL